MMPRMTRLLFAALFAVACSEAPEATADAGSVPVDAGSDESDAGSTGITFRLEYVSDDLPSSIFVQASDYSGEPAWITVKRASGERVRMFRPCDFCACSMCGQCGVCGAAMPRVDEVASGASATLDWNGVAFPNGTCGANEACFNEGALAAGSYVATFCWGTAQQNDFVSSLECKDVPFEHPVAGGIVRHLVDRAG